MSEATEENGGGKGPEGTIPDNDQGIGLTADDNPSGFEPEEDPGAVEDVEDTDSPEPGDDPEGGDVALGHS
ncbi:hypothetical protein [Kocuria sp.]|jgi:hypothetical protein|uniref:hypothetical protein n=1 Tax=Kocuria sp. TaxID=1871328 RepID=UPI002810B20F|nr:hypothetical protein [Kocuria sp.]HST72282.1 hypothetical protein [Kocuria rosea]